VLTMSYQRLRGFQFIDESTGTLAIVRVRANPIQAKSTAMVVSAVVDHSLEMILNAFTHERKGKKP